MATEPQRQKGKIGQNETEASMAVKTFSPDTAGTSISTKGKEKVGSVGPPGPVLEISSDDEGKEKETEKETGIEKGKETEKEKEKEKAQEKAQAKETRGEKEKEKQITFDEERDKMIEDNKELFRRLGLDKIGKNIAKPRKGGRKKKVPQSKSNGQDEGDTNQAEPQGEKPGSQVGHEEPRNDQDKTQHDSEPQGEQETLRNQEDKGDQEVSSRMEIECEPQVGKEGETEKEGEDEVQRGGEDNDQDKIAGASDTLTNKRTQLTTSASANDSSADSSIPRNASPPHDSPTQESDSSPLDTTPAPSSCPVDKNLTTPNKDSLPGSSETHPDAVNLGKQATPLVTTSADSDPSDSTVPINKPCAQGSDASTETARSDSHESRPSDTASDAPMLDGSSTTAASDATVLDGSSTTVTSDAMCLDPPAGLPNDLSDFVSKAVDYLLEVSNDEGWRRVVVTWACIEAVLGYPGRNVCNPNIYLRDNNLQIVVSQSSQLCIVPKRSHAFCRFNATIPRPLFQHLRSFGHTLLLGRSGGVLSNLSGVTLASGRSIVVSLCKPRIGALFSGVEAMASTLSFSHSAGYWRRHLRLAQTGLPTGKMPWTS